MKPAIMEVAQRPAPKFKHILAGNIWAFVHGKGELNYEEHNHLKRCKHCDAIFKYFVLYVECSQLKECVEDFAGAA